MFNVLTVIVDRFVLIKNKWNTVSMAFQSFHAPVRISVEAYERLMMRIGLIFWERQRMQVKFLEYRVEVVTGSLLTHRQMCGTQFLYWRRVTNITPGAPSATVLCPTSP